MIVYPDAMRNSWRSLELGLVEAILSVVNVSNSRPLAAVAAYGKLLNTDHTADVDRLLPFEVPVSI